MSSYIISYNQTTGFHEANSQPIYRMIDEVGEELKSINQSELTLDQKSEERLRLFTTLDTIDQALKDYRKGRSSIKSIKNLISHRFISTETLTHLENKIQKIREISLHKDPADNTNLTLAVKGAQSLATTTIDTIGRTAYGMVAGYANGFVQGAVLGSAAGLTTAQSLPDVQHAPQMVNTVLKGVATLVIMPIGAIVGSQVGAGIGATLGASAGAATGIAEEEALTQLEQEATKKSRGTSF